jgi:RNA polymerase sigma-70 factor (ECF subfamily)
MPPEETEEARWFAANLQPHEPMLRAWLRSRFSDEKDLDDIVQESYTRVLEARKKAEISSPKAFFFATARNLVLGGIRKQASRRELSLADIDVLGVLDETEDVSYAVSRSEELEFLTEAIQSLPTRCRQIITLRKIYGMSQKDIARELGISVHTVESQGTIGMCKLAEFFKRMERRSEFSR